MVFSIAVGIRRGEPDPTVRKQYKSTCIRYHQDNNNNTTPSAVNALGRFVSSLFFTFIHVSSHWTATGDHG